MASVSFKGNIGKVRGLQFNPEGKPRFGFSVAESHSKPDGNGGWTDIGTTWWNVTTFGKEAENLAEVIQEGQKQRVVVTGRSVTREYESNGTKGSSLDVVSDFVGITPTGNAAPQQAQRPAQQPANDGWGASTPPF